MPVLVFTEHDGATIKPDSLHAIAAAQTLSGFGAGDIHLLVVGSDVADVAAAAASISDVAKILVADSEMYRNDLAETLAALVAALASGYSHVLAASTTTGKNFMPRAAALVDVAQLSDISGILSGDTFLRPIYAGSAIATVQSKERVKFITVRTASFPTAAPGGGSAVIEPVAAAPAAVGAEFVGQEIVVSARPDLGAARIVVSGGRGMQSRENFKLIEDLADRLGAAVGASRAAVDSGFAPNEQQVGQTGRIVAPELYIAVGISGAIQHLAGMKDSKVIVAINKDEEAPIFQVADYGLVGDLFTLVPELNAELDRVRG